MIYQMRDVHLDLSKLEFISEIMTDFDRRIKGEGDYPTVYYFRYSINGFTWNTNTDVNKNNIIKIREDLITTWKNYKDKK